MTPISGADIEQYVRFRWMKAGGKEPPFSADAIHTIAQASHGVPRLINVICDNALMQAFAEESATVHQQNVLSACADLRLKVASPSPVLPLTSAPFAPAAPPAEPVAASFCSPMKTLERYNVVSPKRSWLARLAGKLGLTQSVETA